MLSLLARRVLRASPAQAVLFLALTVANVGNFGFHALASHQLGPASYGALGSILSLIVAVTVPATAYQAVLCGQVRRVHEQGRHVDVATAVRRLAPIAVLAAGGVAVTAPTIARFLHMPSPAPVIAAGVYLLPLMLSTIGWAAATGTGRFRGAAVAVAATVITRILIGALAFAAGAGVTGAVVASVLSETVLAVLLLAVCRSGRSRKRCAQLDLGWSSGRYATVSSVGLWGLTGADALLARHLFPGATSGIYVAAATVARIAMFIPQSVSGVLVPDFAGSDLAIARRTLRRALLLSGTVGAVAAGLLVVAAPALSPVLFGNAYVISPALIAILAAAAVLLALLYVVVQFHLARGSRRAFAPWAGVATMFSAALLLHPSALPLASLLLVSTLLALVLAVNGVTLAVLPARPGLQHATQHELDLTVVIPYYNPGSRLRPNVIRLIDALHRSDVSFEVVAVSDGSTDGSSSTLADLDPTVVQRIELPRNFGKGEAICAGLRAGRGRYLGFIDADGDLDPLLWQPILALLRLYRPDAVVGSKWHPLSDVQTTRLRRVYSRGYRVLHRVLFRLPVGDTQVGLKVFRRELLADALPYTQERRFTFDLEVLAIAHRLGYRRIMEAPISLVPQGQSTIRARSVVAMLVETVRLAWRLHTLTPVAAAHPAAIAVGRPASSRPTEFVPAAVA